MVKQESVSIAAIAVILISVQLASCSLPRLPAKLMFREGLKFFHLEDANKIVGGTQAEEGQIPYQVSLQRPDYFDPDSYSHFCGGSLISSTCVVTASHCVHYKDPEEVVVFIGSHTLYTNDSKPYKVEKVLSNPAYNASTVQNDVAVLKLKTPVKFSNTVKPIALPGKKFEPVSVGTKAIVSGWGTTTEGGVLSTRLLYTEVPIVSDATCQRKYGKDEIYETMLCAGDDKGGKDSCQGDSGGPLVANDELIGIVSWGFGCARPNYPGVYTEVSYYEEYIEKACQ